MSLYSHKIYIRDLIIVHQCESASIWHNTISSVCNLYLIVYVLCFKFHISHLGFLLKKIIGGFLFFVPSGCFLKSLLDLYQAWNRLFPRATERNEFSSFPRKQRWEPISSFLAPKRFRSPQAKFTPPPPCQHSLPHWTQCVDLCKKGSSSFLFVIFILPGGFAFQSDFYIWTVQPVSSRRPSEMDRRCLVLVLCVCLFVSEASQFK